MRALIIDDARAMRLILRQILQKIGFEVFEAVDGRDGLDKLRQIEKPDVILVDYQMPVMDGPAFIQALRSDAALRQVNVILVTAEDGAAMTNSGADECIVKPFNLDILRAKFDRLGISVSQP